MSNLTLWSRPFDTDRWVRDFFAPATLSDWRMPAPTPLRPAAEIARDGDDAVVRLELPGVDVDTDVHVEVDGHNLVIHGERRDEYAAKSDGDADGTGTGTGNGDGTGNGKGKGKDPRTLREVRYGSFRRSFSLPAHITGDAVTASYDAGVLTVRVAGVYAGSQPHRIAITK